MRRFVVTTAANAPLAAAELWTLYQARERVRRNLPPERSLDAVAEQPVPAVTTRYCQPRTNATQGVVPVDSADLALPATRLVLATAVSRSALPTVLRDLVDLEGS
jgi:hypothetical protein